MVKIIIILLILLGSETYGESYDKTKLNNGVNKTVDEVFVNLYGEGHADPEVIENNVVNNVGGLLDLEATIKVTSIQGSFDVTIGYKYDILKNKVLITRFPIDYIGDLLFYGDLGANMNELTNIVVHEDEEEIGTDTILIGHGKESCTILSRTVDGKNTITNKNCNHYTKPTSKWCHYNMCVSKHTLELYIPFIENLKDGETIVFYNTDYAKELRSIIKGNNNVKDIGIKESYEDSQYIKLSDIVNEYMDNMYGTLKKYSRKRITIKAIAVMILDTIPNTPTTAVLATEDENAVRCLNVTTPIKKGREYALTGTIEDFSMLSFNMSDCSVVELPIN